jgi:guanylate kinase
MKLSKRIIIVGKAASGKDYFKDFLIEKGFIPSVSHTTRPMRDGEINGETYDFISTEDFMFMASNDQFFEYKLFNQWGYGTSQLMWDTAEVFIFTPSGINSLPKKELDESVLVYFDIPLDERINRLEERSDADTIDRRLKADNADFKDFKEFDIRVKNPKFNAEELLKLIIRQIEIC